MAGAIRSAISMAGAISVSTISVAGAISVSAISISAISAGTAVRLRTAVTALCHRLGAALALRLRRFVLTAAALAAAASLRPEFKLRRLVFTNIRVAVFLRDQHFHRLPQHIDTLHFTTLAVFQRYLLTDVRQFLIQPLIGALFIFQTAHQTAADTADLHRIQREILLLRHLDRYRRKIRQKRLAAQRPAADADSAENLGLVAHTDLPQLDTRLEHRREIAHQLTEINPSVRGKIIQHLIVIKCIFRTDQLHWKPVLSDLLQADLISLFLLLVIVCLPLVIFLRGNPDHRLERLNHLRIVHIGRCQNHTPIFHAADCLDNHIVMQPDIVAVRVEIIELTGRPETHTNHSDH